MAIALLTRADESLAAEWAGGAPVEFRRYKSVEISSP